MHGTWQLRAQGSRGRLGGAPAVSADPGETATHSLACSLSYGAPAVCREPCWALGHRRDQPVAPASVQLPPSPCVASCCTERDVEAGG